MAHGVLVEPDLLTLNAKTSKCNAFAIPSAPSEKQFQWLSTYPLVNKDRAILQFKASNWNKYLMKYHP